MNRRKFIRNSALGIMGTGVLSHKNLSAFEHEEKQQVKIKEYRILGRTEFKTSDIACGAPMNDAVLRTALDAGINYIDTAEMYGNGGSERIVGEVVRDRDRKSLFITTKLIMTDSPVFRVPAKNITKEGIKKRFHKCLERLQTDYADCLMNHAAHNIDSVKSDAFHEAVKELKSEGRLKHAGLSHHGKYFFIDAEDTMENILLTAVEDGRFDVLLFPYNFLREEASEKVLKACDEKKIGVTLMKINPVTTYFELKESAERLEKEGKVPQEWMRIILKKYKEKIDQASNQLQKMDLNNPREVRNAGIRFVLSNSDVHTACIAFENIEMVEDYVGLSGSRLKNEDKKLLAAYSNMYGSFYCRHACGLCEPQCPNQVPINTIMRYNHYYQSQGKEKLAMIRYKELPASKADLCTNCQGYCEAACPYDVPIHGLLALAHRNLTLT